jgi:adiponectin receptor
MRHFRPEPLVLMPCRSSSMVAVNDDPIIGSRSTAISKVSSSASRRRKTSISQRLAKEFKDNKEAVFTSVGCSSQYTERAKPSLQLNQFVTDLTTRSDVLSMIGKDQKYKLDAGTSRAYAAIHSAKEPRFNLSGHSSVNRPRARAVTLIGNVENVYSAYRKRLPTIGSLEAKTYACIHLLESFVGNAESSLYTVRTASYQAFNENWKFVEGSLTGGLKSAREGLKSARKFVDEPFETAKASLKQSILHAKQKAKERGLIRYEDLPTPWQINPHILKGYRFCESKLDCFYSIFQFTNEFVNIWSHATGLICILAIAFYFTDSANYLKTTSLDNFFVMLFLAAACKCLICSCTWHTMNSIADQSLLERFACVDYTGISLLIAASIMSTEHIAFYCYPITRWTYITSTGILGIIGVMVPWHPFFNRNEQPWLRVAFFTSLGATGLIPIIQLSYMYGPAWVYYFYAPITKSWFVYVVGAIIYATKVPEKYIPGVFDYFGGSHNIWHFAVLGGIFFHYNALSEMFTVMLERAASECPNL